MNPPMPSPPQPPARPSGPPNPPAALEAADNATPEVAALPTEVGAEMARLKPEEEGERIGLRKKKFETLAQTLLRAGEGDQFAEALAGGDAARRMQLKTLLFGMGETFRVLTQGRDSEWKG